MSKNNKSETTELVLASGAAGGIAGDNMTENERKIATDLLHCIPANWCDPLLTGDDAVLSKTVGKYDCDDIERLLTAIRKRMENKIKHIRQSSLALMERS